MFTVWKGLNYALAQINLFCQLLYDPDFQIIHYRNYNLQL